VPGVLAWFPVRRMGATSQSGWKAWRTRTSAFPGWQPPALI